MIEKLKQNDRIEFMLKDNRINNGFYHQRLVTAMFGFTGIILLSLNEIISGWACIFFFILGCVLDYTRLKKSKAKLQSEYFDVKVKEKKK